MVPAVFYGSPCEVRYLITGWWGCRDALEELQAGISDQQDCSTGLGDYRLLIQRWQDHNKMVKKPGLRPVRKFQGKALSMEHRSFSCIWVISSDSEQLKELSVKTV